MLQEPKRCDPHGPLWKWRGRLRCIACRQWIPKRTLAKSAWQLVNLSVAKKRALLRAFSGSRSARYASQALDIDAQKAEQFFRVVRAACLVEQTQLGRVGAGAKFAGPAKNFVTKRRRVTSPDRTGKSLTWVPLPGSRTGIQDYVCIRLSSSGRQIGLRFAHEKEIKDDRGGKIESILERITPVLANMNRPCSVIHDKTIEAQATKRVPGHLGWTCIPYKLLTDEKEGPAKAPAWAFVPKQAERRAVIGRAPNHIENFWLFAKWLLNAYRAVPLAYLHLYLAEAAWKFNHRGDRQAHKLEKLLQCTDGHALKGQIFNKRIVN